MLPAPPALCYRLGIPPALRGIPVQRPGRWSCARVNGSLNAACRAAKGRKRLMATIERRAFMKGATLGALAFTVGGSTVMLTTREARARNVPFRLLKEAEADIIEAIGDTLVQGARSAGVAHFIDQQVSVPPEEALLQARILNVRPPFVNFYRAAVNAIDSASQRVLGYKFAEATPDQQTEFVHNMRQNKIDGWQGPPAPFVYTILRSDAVDVVYGTMEGYEMLGIPYQAHIAPEKRW
jgi:gluconate 2-dehydrogenase subunit 3-like protein